MRYNWKRIGLHTSFWVVYLVLNGALSCLIRHQPLPEALPEAMFGELFVLPYKMGLTYFVFYYIIPLYLDRSKVWKLVGTLLSGFVITILLYRLAVSVFYFPVFQPETKIDYWNWKGLFLTAFDVFITLAAAVTLKMIRVHYKSKDFEQELIREKLQSELNFLRAQTNPHFLFNTLNNLYVLAWKKSDKTADAIMMLSKIMRFLLYDCRAPRISVSEEAKVIRDYIELEKLRYNERLNVQYDEMLDNPSVQIAPLLLLPFVENSFKHGANSTTGDASITIHLSLHNNTLHFTVENTDEAEKETISANGNGIGLKNVRRQLDLIYPLRHELNTLHENGMYKVQLTLHLQED